MKYYFHSIERLQFPGLNPNETACVIIYLLCALWIMEKHMQNIKLVILLFAAEIVISYFLARTMSRGGIVAVLIVALVVGLAHKQRVSASKGVSKNNLLKWEGHQTPLNRIWNPPSLCKIMQNALNLKWEGVLNALVAYPIWRASLITVYPGIWGRMSPSYMADDAAVGNRFTLWKGALRLYSGAFTGGWGWSNTGRSYINWMQSSADRTEYNGLVNSFLQIGVAFGGFILAAVLTFLILGLLNSYELIRKKHEVIGPLCFLWTITWMVCSCFSTMMRSSILV